MNKRSGPAYIYKAMAALIQAGIERGLPQRTAEALVRQSALGAAFLAVDEPRHMQDLVNDVCVPGGSTEKAMGVLEGAGFSEVVSKAVEKSLQANRAMSHCHRNVM
jgi:pyrroline-5-carboxylate reductase